MSALSVRSFEYWLSNYRRTWRGTVLSSVLNPLLYLTAMGVGLGTLIDGGGSGGGTSSGGSGAAGLGGVGYLVFIAPGLLAATAMQVAMGEASYPVLGAVKWQKVYYAMLATPLGVRDVLRGHLGWMLFRIATSSAVYVAVMAAFGVFRSGWAVLALPAAVLTGMAFAAPVAAFAITLQRDNGFAALFRFGMVPLFLFSGTFFPVGQLPDAVEPVAYVTPLWHGVDLCRDLSLGTAGLVGSALHAGYLALWFAAGTVAASVTFARRLVV